MKKMIEANTCNKMPENSTQEFLVLFSLITYTRYDEKIRSGDCEYNIVATAAVRVN